MVVVLSKVSFQRKHFTQVKIETSVIHIFDEGLTAFIVVQF